MPIPKHVDEQMWNVLDQLSDETGEVELNCYTLMYESYSPICFPPKLPENFWRHVAAQREPTLIREWNAKKHQKPIVQGHDEHLGLYGVTYALYRRTK